MLMYSVEKHRICHLYQCVAHGQTGIAASQAAPGKASSGGCTVSSYQLLLCSMTLRSQTMDVKYLCIRLSVR